MNEIEKHKEEFIAFKPQLLSYLYRLTTHKQDAEDLAQDTFVKAFDKIALFNKQSTFKTWVFAIATNLAKDHKRVQMRWGEHWMDLVRDAHKESPELFAKKSSIVENSPHGKFVLIEHLNYCFNCTIKTLLVTEQICLWLKEVYDFKISEIIIITALSEGKVKHALANARLHLNRIFEKKCALINKQGTCSQCTGLNKIYNPKQDQHIEANKVKMVKEQGGKNIEELLNLRLQLIKNIDPLQSDGIDLHNYLIENSPGWAQEQEQKK
ncbi:MAG: RNA polymerase sigma factor [Chitinophagaceae bacterium]